MKKKYGGAVCLAGNIDIEYPLAHGTPEEEAEDVRRHMEVMKPGGGVGLLFQPQHRKLHTP